jgi:heterodisulfide reductase subunit B
MRIGLFIPCFIDAFAPEVSIATLELLERVGLDVIYPRDQTCCAQPLANAVAARSPAASSQASIEPQARSISSKNAAIYCSSTSSNFCMSSSRTGHGTPSPPAASTGTASR